MPFARLAPWLLVTLLPSAVSGVVVYRWGNAPRLSAAEAALAQVRHSPWAAADPDSGGQTYQLRLDEAAIGALELSRSLNLAPPAQLQGGVFAGEQFGMVFDGDPNTVWRPQKYKCGELSRVNGCDDIYGFFGTVQIDLKGAFLIDRLVVISGLLDPVAVARDFRFHLAPEAPMLTFRPGPFRPVAVEVRDNREAKREVRVSAPERSRFLQVTFGEHDTDWAVHEIEVFGRGFVEQASYTSNLVDFGRPMVYGELRWSGAQGEGSRVFIQTRSGQDDDPLWHWRYTGRGKETERVARQEYERLRVGERAGTSYDKDGWTFWSPPFDFGDSLGAQILSLGPRRYFQVRVDFLPGADDGGQLRWLEMRASDPVATALVGEVWPVTAAAGERTRFTYVLRPTIRAADSGFDRLDLRSPSLLHGITGVRIGDVPAVWDVEVEEPHRVVVRLPRLDARASGALVEVEFEAEVLRYGSSFEARVADSEQPAEVSQGVQAGDATSLYDGNGVSVATSVRVVDAVDLRVAPAVVTPNGDGHNDEVALAYDVFEITAPARLRVELWDLAGRRVRLLHDAVEGIGRYASAWDGRDDAGRLVRPGLYVARVCLQTDAGRGVAVATVGVAY